MLIEGDGTSVTPAAGTPQADPPAAPTTPPATPAAGTPPTGDSTKIAEELGMTKGELKKYKEFSEQANPVLETIWSDPDLLKQVTEKHKRRLGQPIATPSDQAPATPPVDKDNRNATVNLITSKFEEKTGINKMSAEDQSKARALVGATMKEMLDPNNNKTIQQVFDEVSLTKLDWYYEKAWDLATKDDQIKKARSDAVAQYQDEERGVIGSLAGGSVPIEQITLSAKEKEIAKKQGVSEADFLENKKAIAARQAEE